MYEFWKPPGEISRRFFYAEAPQMILNGPIGSGKTTTNYIKHVHGFAARQPVSPVDGRRHYKLCVVHMSYRQLWRSTIPSWWELFPRDPKGDSWKGGNGEPARQSLMITGPDGVDLEFDIEFVAIGDNRAEDVLRGYNPTAFYLNELDLHSPDVWTYAFGRCGRFPGPEHGGSRWAGVTADCNAPEFGTWLYDMMYGGGLSEGTLLFKQPPAVVMGSGGKWEVNPRAENLDALEKMKPGYYGDQVRVSPDWYIRRMLANEPGFSQEGKPVYPEFDDSRHMAPDVLKAIEGLPLLIGLDAGMTPAAVIKQRTTIGQWRALDEISSEPGTGPVRFGETLLRLLQWRYPSWLERRWGEDIGDRIKVWCDPSATFGGDRQNYEDRAWAEIVAAVTGLRIRPAPTNAIAPRLEAVRSTMLRTVEGHQPAYLMSPRCSNLRRGHNGGYRYRAKSRVTGGTITWEEIPDKFNEFSHLADAEQYVHLGGGEGDVVMGRERRETTRQALLAEPTGRSHRDEYY